MTTKSRLLTTIVAGAVVMLSAQVYAHTIAQFARPGNFLFSATVNVPLNAAGATSVTYTGSGRRTIIYSAECAHSAAGTNSWVHIAIVVDGVELSPTGNNTADSFCTSNGTSGLDGWVTATNSGRTASLGAGTHTVVIRASLAGAGTGSLGDSSLLITR